MPRYYCDYCDVFLTHDSAAVRGQHNRGLRHRDNVRDYYQKIAHELGTPYSRIVLLAASAIRCTQFAVVNSMLICTT